jgi:hypothetical protein
MGRVLTEDTVLKCAATPDKPAPHGGTLSKSGTNRVKVDGQKVLTAKNVLEATMSSTAPCQNDPNAGQVKCTRVLANPPDPATKLETATKLKVDGEFVVIDPPRGTTDGVPPGTIAVSGVRGRLMAE